MTKTNEGSKGSNFTPVGTLSTALLSRHKLDATAVGEESLDPKIQNGWGHRKALKNLVEMISLYRLQNHKVLEKKVARPLVNSAGYFLNAMKPEFRQRDRAPQSVDESGVIAANLKANVKV